MEATLDLMDLAVDGGGGTNGSISTVSKEEKMVLLSSDASSSSYPDESELELGLGLSLGSKSNKTGASRAKILTAKNFSSLGSNSFSSSSSSSATKINNNNNASCGTKRAADSISPPRSSVSQVVGWPPVRTYRMNTLVNQTKSPPTEDFAGQLRNAKAKLLSLMRVAARATVLPRRKGSSRLPYL